MSGDASSRAALPVPVDLLPERRGELRALAEGVGRLALEDFAERFALELEGRVDDA